jgi:hypothetical protein
MLLNSGTVDVTTTLGARSIMRSQFMVMAHQTHLIPMMMVPPMVKGLMVEPTPMILMKCVDEAV